MSKQNDLQVTNLTKIFVVLSAEYIIFNDNAFFISGIMHVTCIKSQNLIVKWFPNISRLKLNSGWSDFSSEIMRDDLVNCAILTIVVSLCT